MSADHHAWDWLPAVNFGRGRRGAEVTGGVDHYTGAISGRAVARWVAGKSVYKGKKVAPARVCGHIIHCRDGFTIQQVKLTDRAYHAGTAPDRGDFWKGEKPPRNVNDFTVGIEHANCGWLIKRGVRFYLPKKDPKTGIWEPGTQYPSRFPQPVLAPDHEGVDRWWEPYTDECIQASIAAKVVLLEMGLITKAENWQGHSDVSPLRKFDPGPLFPREHIMQAVFGKTDIHIVDEIQEDDDDPDVLGQEQDLDLVGYYDDEEEMCLVPDSNDP